MEMALKRHLATETQSVTFGLFGLANIPRALCGASSPRLLTARSARQPMESESECESRAADAGDATRMLACGDNADEWPALGGGASAADGRRLPVVPARLHSCAEVKFALLDRLPAFTEPDLHTDLRRARQGATVPLWSPGYARDMDAWQREALHQQRLSDERPEFSR